MSISCMWTSQAKQMQPSIFVSFSLELFLHGGIGKHPAGQSLPHFPLPSPALLPSDSSHPVSTHLALREAAGSFLPAGAIFFWFYTLGIESIFLDLKQDWQRYLSSCSPGFCTAVVPGYLMTPLLRFQERKTRISGDQVHPLYTEIIVKLLGAKYNCKGKRDIGPAVLSDLSEGSFCPLPCLDSHQLRPALPGTGAGLLGSIASGKLG